MMLRRLWPVAVMAVGLVVLTLAKGGGPWWLWVGYAVLVGLAVVVSVRRRPADDKDR